MVILEDLLNLILLISIFNGVDLYFFIGLETLIVNMIQLLKHNIKFVGLL